MIPTASPADDTRRYELRFQSLFHTGRALAFPCDAGGQVRWEALSERGRDSLARARAQVGRKFASPSVQLSALH